MRISSLARLAALGTVTALTVTTTAMAQSRLSTTTTAVQKATVTTAPTMTGCSVLLEGTTGESSDGSMAIYSFSWGVSNAGSMATGGGMGAGKVSMSDISFMKRTDKASPQLLLRALGGTRAKSAVLSCRNASGAEYYKVTLQDVLISSFTSQSGDGMPSESISLNFTKIEYSYSPQKADGSLDTAIKATYDLKANKK
jgi:type VI secretion system secreted protein Hcp